jgi:hypothetical protein
MEITIYLECPNTEILGVFGKGVHLLTHVYKEIEEEVEDFECILIVPENVYIKEWKKWLKGKKEYCERFNHYCGVMGYVHPSNPELIGTQKINRWNEKKQDMEIVEVSVYKADIFNEEPDFEHG